MRDDCLYCGAELVKIGHWGHCPVCAPEWIPKPPAPPEPVKMKGRPTINGVKW